MTINELADRMIQLRFLEHGELVSFPGSFPNMGEERVLLYLFQVKDGILVGELTEALKLSTGRIANVLKQLEKKGLLQRVQQTDDKRRYEVRLTKKGKAHAEALFEEAQVIHREFLKKMGKKDSEELLRLLEKTVTILNK